MILLVLGCEPTTEPNPVDTGSAVEACSWDVDDTTDAIYVDDDAEPDGDGSLDRPFQTLNEAVTAGPLILIHPGRYAWVELLVHRADPVVLMGTCRDEVWIEGADGRPGVYLQAGSTTQMELHDVSVTSDHHGIGAWKGLLLVDDVLVQDVSGFGIYAGGGADVTVRNTDVEGVEASALGNATGLIALDFSSLTATDTRVRKALHAPVSALGEGSEIWLERFHASEGPAGGLDVAGGAIAQDGGFLSCVDCELDDLANAGLAAIRGGSVVAERVTIRRTHGESGTTAGLGAAGDASLVISDSSVLDVVGAGVVATAGGHVQIDGLVLDNITGTTEFTHAFGLGVRDGGIIDAVDVHMRGIEGAGVEVQEGICTVQGLDFAEPTPGVPDLAGRMAAPAALVNRGHLNLTDSVIHGAVGFAISVQNDGTAELSGIELSQTASFDGEVTGVDLVVNSDAIVTAQSLTLLGPTSTGVGVQGATLFASDFVLEPSTGFGIGAYEGGVIDLVGASITGRGGAALVAFGEGAEVSADEVDIQDTHRTASIKLAIAATGYGGTLQLSNATITNTEGVALSAENGHLDCTHCEVEGALLAGVLIENGTASLSDVTVRDIDAETTTGLALGVIVAATGDGAAALDAQELDVRAGFGGLFVVNATATVQNSTLESEGPIELLPGVWTHGDGVFVCEGVLSLTNSTLNSNTVGVAYTLSELDLEGNTFVDNETDVLDVLTRPKVDTAFLNIVDLGEL